MNVTFRPLPFWPYGDTRDRRSRYAFKAGWSSTIDALEREIRMLRGAEVVIGGRFSERDIRLDGMLRADAATPSHPGIELSFEAFIAGRRQRLVYATDVFSYWQHNVRAIALGLEALRAVDRYGITRAGEQYAGFLALPDPHVRSSVDRGRDIVATRFGGSLRDALFGTHPDHGGDAEDFAAVNAFREKNGG